MLLNLLHGIGGKNYFNKGINIPEYLKTAQNGLKCVLGASGKLTKKLGDRKISDFYHKFSLKNEKEKNPTKSRVLTITYPRFFTN